MSWSRRNFLKNTACGFGYTAFAGLAAEELARATGAEAPLAPRRPHFAPKVKRVIFLFMQGAPSQHETFDYNPELEQAAGQTAAADGGSKQAGKILPSVYKFNKCGESGIEISETFPHLSKHADSLCLLNGMATDTPAHPQASIFTHCGNITFVRPSMGAWALYGLGTENQDLPGFVTMNPAPVGGALSYGAAFLPASFQGTRINIAKGQDPIDNIRNARLSQGAQRAELDFVQQMNREMLERSRVDNEVEGVIQSYELAFRMQTSVPAVMDVSKEPESVRAMYGLDRKETQDFGTQCLLARRMAEAGVRFIELGMQGWDQHTQLRAKIASNCAAIDQPIAALLTDLKQRGLFEDTLIVWGGEFGRSTFQQNNSGDGRRHNNRGYSMWMAGGGVKGGLRHGRCDATGQAVEGKVHLHDLHATMLHLLGLDHKRLTYRYSGRDFRLTDVHGRVVEEILS
ncbi:MAG: DUF1501 domain-containing protein [Acidobacteria bacterium]|nr:DUF1501 domain-containing protein [Acidobacteriota bacterium]